jgi:beta-glucosidase-like glycosyl hydrolase
MPSPVPFPRLRPGLGVLVPAIRLPGDYARVDFFRELARDGAAGFLVFGGDDELLPPFLRSLHEAAGRPLLTMTDAERGVGQQVNGCLHLPPLMSVGATFSEERAYQHGRTTGIEARAMGFNMLLAPVADVLSLPTNPILGNRSFGANPDLVAKLVAAWVAGAQDQGVLACAKHFPGHGDTASDSHAALPVVTAELELLRRRELKPFQAAVAAGVGAIMTAHVVYPALDATPGLPATLSRKILVDLLREEMGFGGLVLSDALIMEGVLLADGPTKISEAEAAVRSIAAGCDLVLHPTDPYEVATALEKAAVDGRIDLDAIDGRLQLTLADLAVDSPELQPVRAEHEYAAFGLARDALTVVRNDVRLLPLENKKRRVFGILLDDDDEPRREEMFRERAAEFAGGLSRCTPERAEPCAAEIRHKIAEAELVFLGVACSIRAWKGRAGLDPRLVRVMSEILRSAGDRTVVVNFSAPGAVAEVDPPPATLVAAWGDAPSCVRAAIDSVLSGGPLRGLDPSGPVST